MRVARKEITMSKIKKLLLGVIAALTLVAAVPASDAQIVVRVGHGHRRYYHHHYYYRHGHRYYR